MPDVTAPTPVPPTESPYWEFYDAVAAAQLAAWAPRQPARVLDISGRDRWAEQLRDAGHEVLRVAPSGVLGTATVRAETRSLTWLADEAVDAVLAESRALSACLATEEVVRELTRVLRPGGGLLLCVESLLTGLARLAELGRWAELADVPAADCVLVPGPDGGLLRHFWPGELRDLLSAGGLEVEWVRPRSVLTPSAVEHALGQGGAAALATLMRTELVLAEQHEGEGAGIHLVASARRPLG